MTPKPSGPQKQPLPEWDDVTTAFMAGLIDGDGSLVWHKSRSEIFIKLNLTDRDTVEDVARLWSTNVMANKVRSNWRPTWYTQAYGYQAQTIIERLYPLFGQRRQERARELLDRWCADRPSHLQLADMGTHPSPEASTAWLAGLFEAEGWFGFYHSSRSLHAGVQMADRDVVDRAASMLGVNVRSNDWHHLHQETVSGEPCKIRYTAEIRGAPAARAMRKMYPHLHSRRRAAIEDGITNWLTRPTQTRRWGTSVSTDDILSGRVEP